MPTNRTKRVRKIINPAIDPAEIFFLQYGTSESGPNHEHLKLEFFLRAISWRETWNDAREKVMDTWIKKNPCTRPWGWWEFDAPRWKRKFEGCFFDGKLPEPRQRLDGVGTENYELAVLPRFEFGLPTGFITKFDEEYYSTKYADGHFKGVAIDPNDPPIFESEAAFLDRHGLLTASERRHLEKHPELLEPEQIEVANNSDGHRDGEPLKFDRKKFSGVCHGMWQSQRQREVVRKDFRDQANRLKRQRDVTPDIGAEKLKQKN